MTQLFLYKNQLIKNNNFTDINNKQISANGITTEDVWLLENDWSISNGQAIINTVTTANKFKTRDILNDNNEYIIIFQISSLTGSIKLNVGGTSYTYTTSGTYKQIFNSNSVNYIQFEQISGTAAIDWVECYEYPNIYNIDLKENIVIPITYSIADIKDISKRNAAFSKTVLIPASPNNNKYFSQIFEISGVSNFNANKKCKAVILEDGIEVFNGTIKLNNIIRSNNDNNYNNIVYDCTLVATVANIFNDLQDIKTSQLDFSEYNHTYSKVNQKNSWTTSVIKNGSVYNNFTNGTNYSVTSAQPYSDSTGIRLKLNLSSAHSFNKGDTVFLTSASNNYYNGDHIVYDIPTSTSVVLYYPYDYSQTGTFTGTIYKHEATGEGYVYPMSHYGHSNGTNWNVKHFFPSVYLKTYIDKIFKKVGYTYTSSFFDSNIFKRLIIPYNKSEIKYTPEQNKQRQFRVSNTSGVPFNYKMRINYNTIGTVQYNNEGAYAGHNVLYNGNEPTNLLTIPFNDDTTGNNYDAGNNYNTSQYYYTCPVTSQYSFDFAINIKKYITVPSGVTMVLDFNNAWDGIILKNLTTNTTVTGGVFSYFIKMDNTTTGTQIIKGTINSVNLTAGHKYALILNPDYIQKSKFYITSTYNSFYPKTSPPYTGDIDCYYELQANSYFYNTSLATTVEEGSTLLMNNAVIDVTAKDLLKSIIQAFNLYIEVDKDNERNLIIETRNDYYSSGTTLDWTDKLDISQNVEVVPLGELTNKSYKYNYKDDKDYLNQDHLNKYKKTYGNYDYIVDNEFVQGEIKNELIFSPTVLADYPTGSNRIISILCGESNKVIDTNIRLLYFNVRSGFPSTYTYSALAGDSTEYLYPYAGHLDNTENPNFDLNFWYPTAMYYTYDSYTSKNLFNLFHKDQLTEITDKDSKLVSMYIKLNSKDINELNFRNIFIIDNHHLRLNKISDYHVGLDMPVKCEFTKVRNTNRYTGTNVMRRLQEETVIDNEQILPLYNRELSSNIGEDSLSNIIINGYNNNINNYNTSNVFISGNDNTLNGNNTNVSLINSNGVTVLSGVTNVSVTNTNGVTITESGTTITNGILITSTGQMINLNINIIDAGSDEVLSPLNSASSFNYIDAGSDVVLDYGTITSNYIDGGIY